MTATSLIGILIMMAAVVVGLVVWLILAYRAARRPYYERYYQRYQPTRRPARAGTRSLASLVDRVHVTSQYRGAGTRAAGRPARADCPED